jgi:hypothetical protein
MPGKIPIPATPLPRDSNSRAAVTALELRELIEETALLHARRSGRARCILKDWIEAESEVQERLAL